jgi:RNase P subunit RPR2
MTGPAVRRTPTWRELRPFVARYDTECPICRSDLRAGITAALLVDDITDDTRTVHRTCLGPSAARRWCGRCWQPMVPARRNTYRSVSGTWKPAPLVCAGGCR